MAQTAEAIATQIEHIIRDTLPMLRSITAQQAAFSPNPDTVWSAKQVVGHLIDSAANNHQRFVRAQTSRSMPFAGYDQQAWVNVQAYQAAAWPDLLDFWVAYNRHLARIIALIPPQALQQPAFAGSPNTLEYYVVDYVEHLKMHLAQIFNLLGLDLPDPAQQSGG